MAKKKIPTPAGEDDAGDVFDNLLSPTAIKLYGVPFRGLAVTDDNQPQMLRFDRS